jgi:hypothetical protein
MRLLLRLTKSKQPCTCSSNPGTFSTKAAQFIPLLLLAACNALVLHCLHTDAANRCAGAYGNSTSPPHIRCAAA